MNDKRFSSLLLLATLVTVFILVGVHFIPNKTLTVFPSASTTVYLLSDTMPDGQASARWTKTDNSQWQCHYPENFSGSYFPCAYAIDLSTSPSTGMDLTSYTHLNLQLTYVGSANKIRIAIRNYNALYSNPNDTNSGKFNNLQIDTQKIKPDSITKIALSAFTVADWWLAQYQIPMDQSLLEFNNTKTIIIDFGEPLKPGIHTLTLTKAELEGVWISTEHAYLIILCIWISGIFIYAAISLIQLNAQLKHDTNVINELSSTNEQLQEQTDRFRKLSTVDPLTQIYNRFGIDQVVASIIKNDHGVYGLMVIDIDHFKRVNDQRGHDVGDQVLQHITAIIQQHLRTGDFIGRWGGEEFIVLMPNTNKDIALSLAEVIRKAIFETPFPTQKPLSLSASFGVGLQLIDEDFSSCFKRVDNALYTAKHQGRNCCIYAKEDI